MAFMAIPEQDLRAIRHALTSVSTSFKVGQTEHRKLHHQPTGWVRQGGEYE